jgi:hypothetical protein
VDQHDAWHRHAARWEREMAEIDRLLRHAPSISPLRREPSALPAMAAFPRRGTVADGAPALEQ